MTASTEPVELTPAVAAACKAAGGWSGTDGPVPQFRAYDPDRGALTTLRRLFSGRTAKHLRRQMRAINAYIGEVLTRPVGEVYTAAAVSGLYLGASGRADSLIVPLDADNPAVAEALRRMVEAGAIEPAGPVEVIPDTDAEGAYQAGRAYPSYRVADAGANERFVCGIEKRMAELKPVLAELS